MNDSYYDWMRNKPVNLLKVPTRYGSNGLAYYWGIPVHVNRNIEPGVVLIMRRTIIMHPLRHIELTSTNHDEWLARSMAWIVEDAHKKLDSISEKLEQETECPLED